MSLVSVLLVIGFVGIILGILMSILGHLQC